MNTLTLSAPAKLNLFLHITGQRTDGYHELQTIFQFLDHSDQLIFDLRNDGEIHINSSIPHLSQEDNLVFHAAKLIQQYAKKNQGVDIELVKNLPMGAGLGGGSSDAATTLVGLNKLWDLKISTQALLDLGKPLGADIPVFINGKACWAEGIGEIMTPMELPEPWFLVLIPPVHVPTVEIFCDKELTKDTVKQTMSPSLLETGVNDCQSVAVRRYPDIGHALSWLSQFGKAQMTGTGACVFAAFESEERAIEILDQVQLPLKGFVAKGVNKSPLYWDVAKW